MRKIAIGIPSSREIRVDQVKWLNAWLSDTAGFEVLLDYDATSGRIDWSRSNLIEIAKRFGAECHIQMDTDVTVLLHLRVLLDRLERDFEAGMDIVVGPTVSFAGHAMIRRKPPAVPTGLRPFRIDGAAFGFVAFSPKALFALKPRTFMGDVMGKKYPIYGVATDSSEDYDLCKNAEECGLEVWADPFILTGHRKDITQVPSWSDTPDTRKLPLGHLRVVQNLPREWDEVPASP